MKSTLAKASVVSAFAALAAMGISFASTDTNADYNPSPATTTPLVHQQPNVLPVVKGNNVQSVEEEPDPSTIYLPTDPTPNPTNPEAGGNTGGRRPRPTPTPTTR